LPLPCYPVAWRLRGLFFLFAWTAPLAAQGGADTTARPAELIHAVVIQRADIFDQEESGAWYARVANALHALTKESVVRREILVHPGEPYDSARVAETERNLRRLGIFRRVQIDTVRSDSGLLVRVRTRDAWSTKLDARVRSGGGDVALRLSLEEDNLFGSATAVGVEYRSDPDRTAVGLEYRRRRLFGSAVNMGLALDARSDGTILSGVVEQPFVSLESRRSFGISGLYADYTVLRFRRGNPIAAQSLARRTSIYRMRGAYASRATRASIIRVGLAAQVWRDDFQEDTLTTPLTSTVLATGGPFFTWMHPRLIVATGVEGFGREEDVDLSTIASVSLYAAPRLFGYVRDGVGVSVQMRSGVLIGSGTGYFKAAAAANGLFTGSAVDSGSVTLGSTLALGAGRRHTLVMHGEAGWKKAPAPGEEFDLGLAIGLRGFRSHAYTGDRTFLVNTEYRLAVFPDIVDVFGLGVAAFADYGGAWYSGEARRTGWDAGVGLRIGINRTSSISAIRLDLAHRFDNDVDPGGWVLSVGRGFPFRLLPGLAE